MFGRPTSVRRRTTIVCQARRRVVRERVVERDVLVDRDPVDPGVGVERDPLL